MLDTIFGLPVHPLVVHAVVVLVPLAAVGAIACTLSTWVRAHVGWLVAAIAVLDVALVPVATGSGESLEEEVGESALLEKHAELGEQLLPFVVVLALGCVAVMALARLADRRADGADGADGAVVPAWAGRTMVLVVAAVTILAAVGTLVQVARIGHSGAKATWSDTSG